MNFSVYSRCQALSEAQLTKVFSHAGGCLFALMVVTFAEKKPLNFMKSHLLILGDYFLLLKFISESSYLYQYLKYFPRIVSSLDPVLKYLINFELLLL